MKHSRFLSKISLHQISRTTSKAEADSFIDSLAFLSKLSSGEFEGNAGEVHFWQTF